MSASDRSSADLESSVVLHFGPFAFDSSACRLSRDGVEVHLTPKAAAVLCLLMRRPGELITKDDFLETVWEGIHVREESLTQAISVIRQALGDSPQSPEFIQTVSGEGYRFIGEVTMDGTSPTPSQASGQGAVRGPAAAAVVATVLVVSAAFAIAWPLWPTSADRPPIRSLAVLPLKHLGEPEEAYFTEAMTELLSARLGQVGALTVINPTSARSLELTDARTTALAAELGVDALIDGSVLWDKERLRIIVRLVDGASGEQLQEWEFTRTLRDVLSLQSQVAQVIVDEIRITPTPEERERLRPTPRPVSPEAWSHWAAGTAIAMGRLGEGLEKAVDHFNAALGTDRDYADAYTGLGVSYVQLGTYGLLPPSEAFPKARDAANKAIDLGDSSGKPYTTLAWTYFVYDHDFERAADMFRRGIELSPNDFGGHHQFAWFQNALGRFEDASVSMERALRLDPFSLVTQAQSAAPYYFQRDYDRALEHAELAREMDPNFGNAYVQLGRIYLARGDEGDADAAIEAFLRARELTPHPRLLGDLVLAYGSAGLMSEAAATLDELEKIARPETTYVDPLAFAWAYLGLGDHEQAIRWLRRAIDEGGNPLPLLIEWDPKYDPLRGDPDFDALVAEVRALRQ